MTPSNENECRQMLYTAMQLNSPSAVRYPRGTGSGASINAAMQALPIGKGVVRRQGQRIALLAFGSLVTAALAAAEQLNASVADMRFVKPIDQSLIQQLASSHELIVTIEENAIMGGAGSAVSEYLHTLGLCTSVIQLGLPDHYIEHGDHLQMLHECGLDAHGIIAAVKQTLSE